MRFCARMARSPEAIWAMKRRATGSSTRPTRRMNSDTSPPAQYSRTRNMRRSSLMMSCSFMMLSWRLRRSTLISDSSDSRSLRLSFSSCISFTATLARVVTCRARHTTANEPRPICFSTSHCPMTRGVETVAAGDAPGAAGEAAASASMLATQRRFSRELTCLARRLWRAGGRRARVDASREGLRAGGGRSRTRRTFGKRRSRLTASTDSALRSRASCFQPRDPSGDPVWIFQADAASSSRQRFKARPGAV